jgi:hypothetical protein
VALRAPGAVGVGFPGATLRGHHSKTRESSKCARKRSLKTRATIGARHRFCVPTPTTGKNIGPQLAFPNRRNVKLVVFLPQPALIVDAAVSVKLRRWVYARF